MDPVLKVGCTVVEGLSGAGYKNKRQQKRCSFKCSTKQSLMTEETISYLESSGSLANGYGYEIAEKIK